MMTVLRLGGVTKVRWIEMSVVVSLTIVSKAVVDDVESVRIWLW